MYEAADNRRTYCKHPRGHPVTHMRARADPPRAKETRP